jgi:hypothetical protein
MANIMDFTKVTLGNLFEAGGVVLGLIIRPTLLSLPYMRPRNTITVVYAFQAFSSLIIKNCLRGQTSN